MSDLDRLVAALTLIAGKSDEEIRAALETLRIGPGRDVPGDTEVRKLVAVIAEMRGLSAWVRRAGLAELPDGVKAEEVLRNWNLRN